MLTRDTCRSVDFTAWRVCPYTHTHTHIYVFEGISSSYVLDTGSGSNTNARGAVGKRSWRGVLHACVHVVGATWAAFRPACTYTRVYIRLHMAGWVGDCVIALGGSRGGAKLREADRVETDGRWLGLLISGWISFWSSKSRDYDLFSDDYKGF